MSCRLHIPIHISHNSHFSRNWKQGTEENQFHPRNLLFAGNGLPESHYVLKIWSEGWWTEGEMGSFLGGSPCSRRLPPTEDCREGRRAGFKCRHPNSPGDFWKYMEQNHLKSTQQEKAVATRQPSDSSPDPVFLRELNRPKSSQLTPHMGTPWMGWLSAVTSVKTQPSSGNSLYFVLFLESNYHLVVCCHREVLFFCVSKHKM